MLVCATDVCPSQSRTVCSGTPPSSHREPASRRRSWKCKSSMRARRQAAFQAVLIEPTRWPISFGRGNAVGEGDPERLIDARTQYAVNILVQRPDDVASSVTLRPDDPRLLKERG